MDSNIESRWSSLDVSGLPTSQTNSSSNIEIKMLADLAGFLAGLEGTYQVSARHLAAAAKLSWGTTLDDEIEDVVADNRVEPEHLALETDAKVTSVRVFVVRLRAVALLLIVVAFCVSATPVQDSDASSTMSVVAIPASDSAAVRNLGLTSSY